MRKIKLLIVDDEPLAHNVLEGYCQKIDYIDIVGHCYDGISTLNFINRTNVDVVLLDIQMPDLTGMELLDTLKNSAPKIIFTTAFTEYALQSFNYDQVVDYLHKPIRLTRFIKALERLKRILLLESDFNTNLEQKTEPKIEIQKSDYISIKDNKIIYRITYNDINHIQSWGNYLKIFMRDQNIKIVRKTIKKLESELSEVHFLRIHKSYIVNISRVRSIEGNRIKFDDMELPIGKSYMVNVKKTISG